MKYYLVAESEKVETRITEALIAEGHDVYLSLECPDHIDFADWLHADAFPIRDSDAVYFTQWMWENKGKDARVVFPLIAAWGLGTPIYVEDTLWEFADNYSNIAVHLSLLIKTVAQVPYPITEKAIS